MQKKIKIYFKDKRIFSNSEYAINLSSLKKIGELKKQLVIYSIYEVIYLSEKNLAEIYYNNKIISVNKLIKLTKTKKDILTNYIIYQDLRNKGYIVKEALKFGCEFRVYHKKDKHARWLVIPLKKKQKLKPIELVSKVRISHSTAKKLLVGIIDSQEDILYLEIDWIKT